MNGNRALLDSNVIIYCSQGGINIDVLYKLYDEFYISIITYIEVGKFT